MAVEEGEPFGEARRNSSGVPDSGEVFEKLVDFYFVAGVNAASEAAYDRFERTAEEHVFIEVNKNSAVIRVDGVVEGLVPAEHDSGKQSAAAEGVVDDAGAGAAGAKGGRAMFGFKNVDKAEGLEA